jgi:hypothetical protein
MENKDGSSELSLLDRLRKHWFAPTAVIGAFAAFTAAVFRVRPEPKPRAAPAPAPKNGPDVLIQDLKPAAPPRAYARKYTLALVIGGANSAQPFRRALSGIAVGPRDLIFALGDGEIRIFDGTGRPVRSWKAPEKAECLAVSEDETVVLGSPGLVEIFNASGKRVGGFAAGDAGEPAAITGLKVFRKEILVADATARLIRRFDVGGKQIGSIGDKSKAGKFMLPNRSLDLDIDPAGVVRATDTGRHLVTAWSLDGTPVGSFGKFGMFNPEDFVGCCNPVNLAMTPDGKVVTAEKMVARVKVYEPDGKLLALIGPENFDAGCTHIYLAVDKKGRILTGDPMRREIKVFAGGSQ